ncbi:TspO/MBR family protein [Sphingomonas sp. SUN039]|uniref:TspO/MBR family protein n=1 Tax=Sphingomonas sp. SUN039 TaxID=2937787 RepID=UPI00216423DA|nr:TspO/MBR family protein [Sphingomonas sp. SUN039]UVO54591.1 tryptophan-rich sensory protein [Sphingomonas sp. SUN039]
MSELASSGQLRAAFWRWALVTVPMVVVLGFLSGALSNSGDANRWYALLDKPWFQPPSWAFPVAWTILYVMLGLAVAIVLNARGSRFRGYAVALFGVAFALNLTWSPVFFGMHRPTMALAIIVGMFVAALATTIAFGRVRKTAAWLMVPYLGWLVFAGILNWEIIRLNPGAEGLVVDRAGTQIDLTR